MKPAPKQSTFAEALTEPAIHTVMVPGQDTEAEHLAYFANVMFIRKPPERKMILCSELDGVHAGDPVLLTYHMGLRCYQHERHISISTNENCSGGFYFTDGTPA